MEKLIFEEIKRIHQLLGTNPPEFLIESILLSEGPIPKSVIRDIERILEPSAKSWIERRLPQSTEPFAKRFERYIASIPNTKEGKRELQNVVKDLSHLSPKFTEEIAQSNKELYERLAAQVGKDRAEQLIRQRLGDEIFEKISRNSPIITQTKPSELLSVSDFKKWMNNNRNYTFNSNNDYTDDVRKAWIKFGKFYLEATKPPALFQKAEEIKLFQNWLDKNHSDWYKGTSETLNRSEAKGYGKYGPKTRVAWEKYEKEYLETLGIKQKLTAVDYGILDAKTLAWFERILSTDKTLSDKIQGTVDKFFQQALISTKGEDKYIEDFYSKFKSALDDNINRVKTGEEADLTTIRNLQQMTNQLAATNKANLETFYNTLESVLTEKTGDAGKVKELMDAIKSQDPFKQGTFFGEGRFGWLTQFVNRTASSKAFQNLGKSFYGKEKAKNFKELLERMTSLLTFGSPKSAEEISNAIQRQNIVTFKSWPNIPKIVWDNIKNGTLYAQLWGAANIGAPVFLASLKSFWYFIRLWGPGNEEEYNGFWDTWLSNLKEEYKNHPTWQYFLPIHSYGWDIIKWVESTSERAYSDEYKNSVNKLTIGKVENSYDNGNLKPSQFVIIMRGLIKDDADLNSINNTQKGFESFCRAAKLDYDDWNSLTKVGKTDDGTKWVWSSYLEVFITKADSRQETEIQPKPENTNQQTPTEQKIDDSEQGFKNWCKKNNTQQTPRIFKSYNKGGNGLGETEDGAFWEFDVDAETFQQ